MRLPSAPDSSEAIPAEQQMMGHMKDERQNDSGPLSDEGVGYYEIDGLGIEQDDSSASKLKDEIERLILDDRFELPPVPAVAQEVFEASSRPQTPIRELARIAHRDAFIAGRVLRLANSAWYGFREPAGSLRDAIVRIGIDEFRNVILTVGLKGEVFRSADFQEEAERAWSHSIACAIAASMIATHSGRVPPHRAFLAGLLHDIGLSVAFKAAAEHARSHPDEAEDIRLRTSGIAAQIHGRVGGLVAEKWSLDPGLTQAIVHHHAPENATVERELVNITAVADAAAFAAKAVAATKPRVLFGGDALSRVGVTGVSVEAFAEKLEIRVDEYIRAVD